MKELTATNLKNELWETFGKLKKGETNPKEANAVAAMARAILSTVKIQLQVAALSKRNLSADVMSFSEK